MGKWALLVAVGSALAGPTGCTVAPNADRIVLIEYQAAAKTPAEKPQPQTAREILEETHDWVEETLEPPAQP